jgi:hypothetical protein
MDDVRFRAREARPRRLPALAAAVLAAALWGVLAKSPWVGATAFGLAAIPVFVTRSARLGFASWGPIAFLLGGTVAAVALLTGHATPP